MFLVTVLGNDILLHMHILVCRQMSACRTTLAQVTQHQRQAVQGYATKGCNIGSNTLGQPVQVHVTCIYTTKCVQFIQRGYYSGEMSNQGQAICNQEDQEQTFKSQTG